MKPLRIMFVVLLFTTNLIEAQDFFSEPSTKTNEKKPFFEWNRVFFGGNFGLQFGDYTIIDFSPLVGYRISEHLSSGFQINYNFIHVSSLNISTTIYGASVFSNYYFGKSFFLRGEYEWLSFESRYFSPSIYQNQQRFNVYSLLLGGGFRQQIGERSYINLMILWNLNESALSPYSNPIIRMSFEL